MIDEVAKTLPAASLLLAVLAVLMNMWNKDVVDALELRTGAEDSEQKKMLRKSLRGVLFWKAAPLFLTGALLFFVFLPPAYDILTTSLDCRGSENCHYQPIGAAFLATETLIGLVFTVLGARVASLIYAMR